MVIALFAAAGAMALFGFVPHYQYPQYTTVAYILSSVSVMIVFASASELLVRLLRTYSIDPDEHAETIAGALSTAFTVGLVVGNFSGGALVEHLPFSHASRVIFYILIFLPFLLVAPFVPWLVYGKWLAKSPSEKEKGKSVDDEEKGGR